MPRIIRHCRRCRRATDHLEEPPTRLAGRWVWLWPIVRLADLVLNRPLCLVCAGPRGEPAADEAGGDGWRCCP